MHVVICLDDRNGIQFNRRRLSSDAAVCCRVVSQCTGRLMMNSSSAKLFSGFDVCIDDDFLSKALPDDTCFVEDIAFLTYMQQVDKITVYRWNRHYPSDIKLPEALLAEWKLTEKSDFPGNSHEIITEERYIR